MAEDGFGRLKTVVFVAADKLRDGIVAALKSQGFREILEARSIDEFVERIQLDSVDLVITLNHQDELAVGKVIRELRLGLLDCSPFPVVLALVPNADKNQVLMTLDSGVDDLLLFPLSSEILLKRIRQFTQDRRPFVVTHDYIGPDRRTSPRAAETGTTLIKVPNPVRSRVVGVSDQEIRQSIQEAILVIDRDKLKQNALHLLRLMREIQGDHESPPPAMLVSAGFLDDCIVTCDDVARRARNNAERDIRERAQVAVTALRSFAESGGTTTEPRFAELIRRLEGVVNEISAYHGIELKL